MVNIMSQLRLKKMLDDIAFDRLPPAWTTVVLVFSLSTTVS